ncbi:uncharacterized protein VP01_161g6 [Puccinia sorghi]|uniref:GPI inositol-deacylase n=1 Tax=Puccinia sorghi TaxID=27349 RepID=A0A0L6VH18_9BASI|nr:uncharacterized protein VP01_161g6 [Puccinia sorghi]
MTSSSASAQIINSLQELDATKIITKAALIIFILGGVICAVAIVGLSLWSCCKNRRKRSLNLDDTDIIIFPHQLSSNLPTSPYGSEEKMLCITHSPLGSGSPTNSSDQTLNIMPDYQVAPPCTVEKKVMESDTVRPGESCTATGAAQESPASSSAMTDGEPLQRPTAGSSHVLRRPLPLSAEPRSCKMSPAEASNELEKFIEQVNLGLFDLDADWDCDASFLSTTPSGSPHSPLPTGAVFLPVPLATYVSPQFTPLHLNPAYIQSFEMSFHESSTLLRSLSILSLLFSIYSFRSFTDPFHALDLHAFTGPSVAPDGHTEAGARGRTAGSCRMTWMNPNYLPIHPIHSRFHPKYSLHLYRDYPWDLEQQAKHKQPSRSPVLFIPGNAGSYRQIRSIASTTSITYFDKPHSPRQAYRARQHPGLDFFTLDFNDDFSAFHGKTLVEQAEFANDAIRTILSIYQKSRISLNSHLPLPQSVLIISHSMGSIVARKMLTMPNYVNGSINTILSLSSPHSIPPITFESGVEKVYQEINTLWRQSYSTSHQNNNSLHHSMVLISISGGTSDTTVSSDSSSLLSLAPSSSSLTVFTTGIPGVWTPIDHLAILWCNQLAIVIARTLLEITEPSKQSQVVESAQDRLTILKSHLLLGHGIEPFYLQSIHSVAPLQKFHIDSLPTNPRAYHIHTPYHSLRLTQNPAQPTLVTHIIPLPSQNRSREDEFTLLSNMVANHRLNVVACTGSFETHLLKSCQSISQRDSQLLPRSQFNVPSAPVPGPDDRADPPQVMTFLQIPHSILSRANFLAIQVLRSAPGSSPVDDDFLISEFRDLSTTTMTGPSSFLSFCLFGASLPLLPSAPPSLVSTVRLPAFVSSLVAFKLDLKRGSECARGGMFAPLMRQETVLLGERKYHPNMRTAIVYTHFSNAYTPARRVSKEETGVSLTFWTDPVVCGGPSEPRRMAVRMRLDVYESVRKMVLRYRTALVSLPAGWLALIMSVQMRRLGENGSVLSLPAALSLLIREDLGTIMLAVGGAQLAQSLVLQTRYSALHDGPPASNFTLVYPPRIVADLLLGQAHSAFILLDWLLLLVSIGWLACVSLLLYLFIWACASLSTHLLPLALGPSLGRWRQRTPSPPSPTAHETIPSMIDYPTLSFLAVVKVFSLLYVPYHLGFLLLTVMQLVTTVQSLLFCWQSDASVFVLERMAFFLTADFFFFFCLVNSEWGEREEDDESILVQPECVTWDDVACTDECYELYGMASQPPGGLVRGVFGRVFAADPAWDGGNLLFQPGGGPAGAQRRQWPQEQPHEFRVVGLASFRPVVPQVCVFLSLSFRQEGSYRGLRPKVASSAVGLDLQTRRLVRNLVWHPVDLSHLSVLQLGLPSPLHLRVRRPLFNYIASVD